MVLEVKKALEQKTLISFDEKISLETTLLSDRMITSLGSCSVNGTYHIANGDVIVRANCSLPASLNCEVCCKPFERVFQFTVHQNIPLQKTPESNYEVESGVIDFEKIVLDEFILSLPSRLLCQEDCTIE